jgi:hypothetical protein
MRRHSFWFRAAAMALPLFALPGTLTAPVFVIASLVMGSIGFASGQLAANERMFRLIRGPAVVRQHARYLAKTSGAMTVGQLASAGVIAVGMPLGYPAFAALYAASTALRVMAYRASAPVKPSDQLAAAPLTVVAAGHETTAEAPATAVA